MTTILNELSNEYYEVREHKGETKFRGCQCIKDCTCHEDFKSEKYHCYSVKRKTGRKNTTTHNTLEEVKERIKLLDSFLV